MRAPAGAGQAESGEGLSVGRSETASATSSNAPSVITESDSSRRLHAQPTNPDALSVRQPNDAHHSPQRHRRPGVPGGSRRRAAHANAAGATSVTKCAAHASGDTRVIAPKQTANSPAQRGSRRWRELPPNANASPNPATAATSRKSRTTAVVGHAAIA